GGPGTSGPEPSARAPRLTTHDLRRTRRLAAAALDPPMPARAHAVEVVAARLETVAVEVHADGAAAAGARTAAGLVGERGGGARALPGAGDGGGRSAPGGGRGRRSAHSGRTGWRTAVGQPPLSWTNDAKAGFP